MSVAAIVCMSCGLPCHLGQCAQGQSLDACSHSCQLSQRLLQPGSAASLRQLCFGHPTTQKVILPIIGLLQLGSRCIGCTPSSSMTGWWPDLRSMACAAQSRLASAHANRPFITSSPCVTSTTEPYCSSAPCLRRLRIFRRSYDTVQHSLLWARLEGIHVSPKMLAAIKSLYASGTLSMKVGAHLPWSSRMGCGRAALSALPYLASSLMACMAI